eukprot:3668674-Rhodomonas_salina.1
MSRASELFAAPAIAVAMNPTETIVDEKQVFIKPTLHPALTEECMKDTGVTQESVDTANPLQAVIQEFNDYVYRSFIANNKDFCL